LNSTTAELTENLVASYTQVGGINHLDGKNLPSKTTIASITCKLLQLLFPGFFDDRLIHSSELKALTSDLVDEVRLRLEAEIGKSLEYRPPGEVPRAEIGALARKITRDLLACLPRLREAKAIPPLSAPKKSSWLTPSPRPLPCSAWPTNSTGSRCL